MRNTLFCLLMVGYISTFAQNGTTFKVENLSKPEKLLFIKSYEDIYKGLILSDLKIYPYEIKEKNINVPFNIIAKSEAPVNPEKPDVPLNKNDAFQKVQKRRVQEKR